MAPKSKTKERSTSTSKCRRSRRIAYRIKSMEKRQSESSKEQPSSTKERRKQPCRKKPVEKTQPTSSKDEQPSSTMESGKPSNTQKSGSKRQSPSTKKSGKPSYSQKSGSKRQSPSTKESGKPSCSRKSVSKRKPASSNEGQSTSTVKRRRVMDEINERVSQIGHEEPENFSGYLKELFEELSTGLEIEDEAIDEMSIYINHIFERLARSSALLLIGRNDVSMTEKDVENAVVQVVEGELAKYCIAEGRGAVKKMEKTEIK